MKELAGIRAAPDPHYGLPIVVCPRCAYACVRTKHPDIEFWRGFRRLQNSVRDLIVRLALIVGAALLFWMLVMVSDELYSPSGRFDPLFPFAIGDLDYLIGGVSVLGGAVFLTMVVSMLMSHRNALFGAMILIPLALFFITIDYTTTGAMHLIATIADFDFGGRMPRGSEMIDRFQRFGYFMSVSMIGVVPAIMLRKTINNTPRRRFRRVLKRKRIQRGRND